MICAECGGQRVSMMAATLSLRSTPNTKGKWATELICCIVIAMRHPFCKLCERLHHSGYPRDDIGLQPACAKNPRTRPLPLEPGNWRSLRPQCMSHRKRVARAINTLVQPCDSSGATC